ncbi:hypothetical protein HY408_01615 [Candidatus Gottesmanbacteria bacterium]|nr:hypothetical protein [Candidatus Gottesmanbacteria bacterium]
MAVAHWSERDSGLSFSERLIDAAKKEFDTRTIGVLVNNACALALSHGWIGPHQDSMGIERDIFIKDTPYTLQGVVFHLHRGAEMVLGTYEKIQGLYWPAYCMRTRITTRDRDFSVVILGDFTEPAIYPYYPFLVAQMVITCSNDPSALHLENMTERRYEHGIAHHHDATTVLVNREAHSLGDDSKDVSDRLRRALTQGKFLKRTPNGGWHGMDPEALRAFNYHTAYELVSLLNAERFWRQAFTDPLDIFQEFHHALLARKHLLLPGGDNPVQ